MAEPQREVEMNYGSLRGGWCTNVVNVLLFFLMGLANTNVQRGWAKFSSFFMSGAGDGTRVKFQLDVWCGDVSFKESFPKLFRVTHDKEASITDHIQFCNDFIRWVLNLYEMYKIGSWSPFFVDIIYSASV